MSPRITRLEFSVVAMALIVLLLCSKPPKSGTASVSEPEIPYPAPVPVPFVEEDPAEADMSLDVDEQADIQEEPVEIPEEPVVEEPSPVGADVPTVSTLSANDTISTEPVKRQATVDARGSQGLKYKNVMHGQVTVRWVWNGQKLVPQKVCVVQEPNGVTSVWSFDNPDGAVLTEVGNAPNPAP